MKEIAAKTCGCPFLLGEFDNDVRMYIKALRKAVTPVSFPVVLAATEGAVTAWNRSALVK